MSYRFHDEVKFECASLIIAWNEDVGRIGPGIADFLKNKLDFRLLAEIEPSGFFPLGGVSVEDDVAQFPESRLFYCAEKGLLLFQSHSPHLAWHLFLNTLLDMVQFHCRLNEIYAVGGMITLNPHTANRQLTSVANNRTMKEILASYDVIPTLNYETPEGQRPTFNSYLLWLARQRNIPAASLWAPIPFYLTAIEDPLAWRIFLEFLNRRFELKLDLSNLSDAITKQNRIIKEARANTPELDQFLRRLEDNQALSQEENDKLIKEIEDILKKDEE